MVIIIWLLSLSPVHWLQWSVSKVCVDHYGLLNGSYKYPKPFEWVTQWEFILFIASANVQSALHILC